MATSTPPTSDDLQKQHEARLQTAIDALAGGGIESDRALVRALIHRGVHLAAERRAGEFCGVATFLAEMIGHVHGLMHGADPLSARHSEAVH
jgi:hypothetical protein